MAGLVLHLLPFTRGFVLSITDITMLVTNSIVLYFVLRDQKDQKLLYWSLITFLLTFLIELAGVRTGLIFGAYHYGRTMFLQILNVPVVIGMNWVMLMLGSFSIAQWMKTRALFIPVLASVMIAGFDFIMESVAVKLDYWQWDGNHVPLQNYVAWFLISLFFSSILVLLKVKIKNNIIKIYFLIQLFFLLGLRLFDL